MSTMINTQNYGVQNPYLQQQQPSFNSNAGGFSNSSIFAAPNQSTSSSGNSKAMMAMMAQILKSSGSNSGSDSQTTSVDSTGDSSQVADLQQQIDSLKQQLASAQGAQAPANNEDPDKDVKMVKAITNPLGINLGGL